MITVWQEQKEGSRGQGEKERSEEEGGRKERREGKNHHQGDAEATGG